MAMADDSRAPSETVDLARIAALDVGERRIGVAISDALGFTAQPLLTYDRLPGNNGKTITRDAKSLLRLLRKAECRRIIVGNPLYLSGEASPQAKRVYRFVEALRAETVLPIQLWDERLSTTEAHNILDSAGHPVRQREHIIDQLAAVLILESYMQTARPQLLPDPSL
jgi:putative Holliday junction resolvase